MTMQICDGCGRAVDAGHIRDRILRLEAATRFRPLHIATLLLAEVPPARKEDDFYWVECPVASAAEAHFFRTQMLEAAGIKTGEKTREAELAEFQRLGYFLAYVKPCWVEPAGDDSSPSAERDKLAATLATRIRFSYKPKRVLLLGAQFAWLTDHLHEAGVQQGLTGLSGAFLPLPSPYNPEQTASFREGMARLKSVAGGS